MATVPLHKGLALTGKPTQEVPDSKVCNGNSGRTGFERSGGATKGRVHKSTGGKSRK